MSTAKKIDAFFAESGLEPGNYATYYDLMPIAGQQSLNTALMVMLDDGRLEAVDIGNKVYLRRQPANSINDYGDMPTPV